MDPQVIGGIVMGAAAVAGVLGSEFGKRRERGRQSAEPPPPPCTAAEESVALGQRFERENAETRRLIVTVQQSTERLVRELRDSSAREMQELRAIEARQNELISTALGEVRHAVESIRHLGLRRAEG